LGGGVVGDVDACAGNANGTGSLRGCMGAGDWKGPLDVRGRSENDSDLNGLCILSTSIGWEDSMALSASENDASCVLNCFSAVEMERNRS
jgi:hypothetical protein